MKHVDVWGKSVAGRQRMVSATAEGRSLSDTFDKQEGAQFGWSTVSEDQSRGDKVNVTRGGDQMEKCLEMAPLEGLGAEE